jgi:ketosteroid isomerase-like protein
MASEPPEGVRSKIRPLRAPGRRTPDEQLRVRWPGLYHALARLLFRLPPEHPLRRRFSAYAMARAYAAANRHDFDLIATFNDDSRYEYRASPGVLPPDLEEVSSRHTGYLQMWQSWIDAFPDIHYDPREQIDFGDRVLVTVEQSGHGSGSGIAISQTLFQLYTFEDGMVVRQEDFLDREEALRAARA